MQWLALAVLAVGLCAPTGRAFAIAGAPSNVGPLLVQPVAGDLCLNHTDVVLESIHTQKTIDATAAVMEARKTCGSEYTWNGYECVRSITASVHCATGYDLLNGRCERVEDAYCPPGYQKSEQTGTCKLRVEFNVDCPPEHDWDGTNCVHRMPGCRSGYQLVNGSCLKLVPGACRVGTRLEQDKCVLTQTAAVVCPDGFELIGTECRASGKRLCDADYRLVDGECVLVQTDAPVYQCPDDMRLEGTKCVSRVHTCPPGYQLNGTQCVNVTISCPANSTLDANGRCVRHECLPVPPSCLEGFRLSGGECYAVLPELPVRCNSSQILLNQTCVMRCRTVEPVCPPPAYLDHRLCVFAQTDRRTPQCAEGFVLNNGWCVYVHPQCVVYLPECEPGFELRDGQCVRRLAVTCPPGAVWNAAVGRCERQDYECLDGWTLVDGRCAPAVSTVCPNGHHRNGTVCVPDQLVPTCPPGSRLVDQWCVKDTPAPICPVGYQLRNGTCYQAGVSPSCPPGYRLYNGLCYCRDSQLPPTETVQPPLTIPTVCPPERPIYTGNGTCTAVNTTRPICIPGYVLNITDGLCHRIDACTNGFRFNTTLQHCVPVLCGSGHVQLPNGQCHEQRPVIVAPVPCPDGYRANANGYCVLVQQPIVCPPGYYYTHSACYPRAPIIVPSPIVPAPQICNQTCCGGASGGGCGGGGGGGHENVVHTVTIVDRPVNVVTNNENNVNVHLYDNGRLVSVQRNNETVVIATPVPEVAADDDNGEYDEEDDDAVDGGDEVTRKPSTAKCCVVVSPRKCVQHGTQWDCAHRETTRCGGFCTSPKIYLIPRRNTYRDNVLVMRPLPSGWPAYPPSFGGSWGGACDCSGCVRGGYACSQSCYQYEQCGYQNDCHQIEQSSFCESNTGDGCTEEDGYYV